MPKRITRYLVSLFTLFVLCQFISIYLSWPKQFILGGVSVVLAIALNRLNKSRITTIALMFLSIGATLRYGWWRVRSIIEFFSNEANTRVGIDAFLMLLLLSAEAYTLVIMVLGYMQTAWPLHREPIPLPADEEEWPHVDVLIPTYNEPLSLVRYTALAAVNIDYPPEKLHVYILDDGTRADFRQFAEEAGIGYVVREKHNHAKAGNINHALTQMSSPLVAIFDCDHVPTRSFLQVTAGWFLADPKLGMLQTPHHFYSPDPFERNLTRYKTIPNEGELFYGLIQDGNDFWNATFFCGSCAVLRRTALNDVGGVAVETVTEDAHTSLKMQKRGWNTAYINIPQAAGLATETLSAHVGQRIRWARGMIQIMRVDNPLLARGLKFTQRLCYFNAMAHFLYAVPRLVFLCAPLVYMLLGRTIIPGYWVVIVAYALPHLVLSSLTNSRIQGKFRHSFWNEIYETVLAPYILAPTLLALINPKLGKFNVTDKGSTLAETRFDRHIAAPVSWMMFLNLLGMLMAPYRLFVLDPQHPGTVIANLFWIVFNMVILGVSAAVAYEQQQRRSSVRVDVRIPVRITLPDGHILEGTTVDMSVGGSDIRVARPENVSYRDVLHLSFPQHTGDAEVPARVVGIKGEGMRLKFEPMSIAEQETLTRAIYSRADAWLDSRRTGEVDRPLLSLARVIRLSFIGIKQVAKSVVTKQSSGGKELPVARTASTILLFLLLFVPARLTAQITSVDPAAEAAVKATDRTYEVSLKDMGAPGTIEMHGPHSFYSVHFTLPHALVPGKALLNLNYRFAPGLAANSGSFKVAINNTNFATLQAPSSPGQSNDYSFTTLTVPEDMLARENTLTFEFNGSGVMQSEVQERANVLGSIGVSSTLQVSGEAIPMSNDLSLLPLPLLDTDLQTSTTIPFVFLTQPTVGTLQAAGVVASWLGLLSGPRPVKFTASVGVIPPGNVVVFSNLPAQLPESLQYPSAANAYVALRRNPNDPTGSVLVLGGRDDGQLLAVAQSLALKAKVSQAGAHMSGALHGDTYTLSDYRLPDPRENDDAPRWMPTDKLLSLADFGAPGSLVSDGSESLPVYFRVPPDLFYGEMQQLHLHVEYRYNAQALAAGSALRIYLNGMLINEAPLPAGEGTSDRKREVMVPVTEMRPFGNTLRFNFDFVPRDRSHIGENAASTLHGEVLPASTLDIRGFSNWAKMPDIELFSNAGFPFTQKADLSETTAVLPAAPSPDEIALYLQMMAHFGTQTGYPVLRVTVAGPDTSIASDRDYLILGTVADQPAFHSLAPYLPVTFDVNGIHIKEISKLLSPFQALWNKIDGEFEEPHYPSSRGGMPDAMIEGFESPYASGRSVVLVALKDDASRKDFVGAFLERYQSSDIAHTVSLLRGGHFTSYDAKTTVYHVGNISWYTRLRIWLTQYFWVLLLAGGALSLLVASWTNDYLADRARRRIGVAELRKAMS
ncbi:UDP-forming cellulose synthase catalytic subunit [Silvibacterium acidisoli]|uniref:UDP-forming cellulose synthase catalytic subunit n=1 Tax=Acidobacteriaceae bacterium ZG23-2 TaxID=2883246 RepID=UPI00406C9043